MLVHRAFLAASIAAAAAAPLPAHAYMWKICNKTPEHLRVAIAYQDRDNQWISRGWWEVRACGGCANVLDLAKTDAVAQFYRATALDGSERLSGGGRFCVNPSGSFHLANRGRCPGGYSAPGFQRVNVEYSDRNFTSNILPARNGPVCID